MALWPVGEVFACAVAKPGGAEPRRYTCMAILAVPTENLSIRSDELMIVGVVLR